jgi:pSer/pThr/pTyr-binding forkhead associated (FHA) protein
MSSPDSARRIGRLIITHGGKQWEAELPPGIATIGRYTKESANTINLAPTDLGVSRHHAEIETSGTAWLLTNKSPNGTAVNNAKVERIELADGDQIKIGSAELHFELIDPHPVRVSGVRLGRAPLPDDELPTPVAGTPINRSGVRERDEDVTEEIDWRSLPPTTLPGNALSSAPSMPPSVSTAPGSGAEEQAAAPSVSAGYGIRRTAAETARDKIKEKKKEKDKGAAKEPAVRPWILYLVGFAGLLFLLMMLFSGGGPDGASDLETLHAEYETYLADNNNNGSINVQERLTELDRRMKAIEWAERVGETDQVRHELQSLLVLDGDRASPVYQYATRRLREY